MKYLVLAAALLIPGRIDSVAAPRISQSNLEVLAAETQTTDKLHLTIDDVDRLIEDGIQAKELGDYQQSAEIAKKILLMEEKILAKDHSGNVRRFNALAKAYDIHGLYSKAEQLYRRSLAISERISGVKHLDTASILNDLAFIYYKKGLYSQAEKHMLRALAIRKEFLGLDDPDTAITIKNLAIIYKAQGLFSKALPLALRALSINKKLHGLVDAETASSLGELASIYRMKGLYAKAKTHYENVLTIRNKILDPNHPDIASSLNSIGLLYKQRGQYKQALPLYERALAIREKILGPDHPETSTSINNLAALYSKQGLYNKAKPLYRRSILIKEKTIGADHLRTSISLNNLALMFYKQGLFEKAEQIYGRVLSIREKIFGSNHPRIATPLNNLALIYHATGRYGKAELYFKRALDIWLKSLGPLHRNTANALNNLAKVYYEQHKYSNAEPLFLRALAIRENVLGFLHPETLNTLDNLSSLYRVQGLSNKSNSYTRRTLAIQFTLIQREVPYLTLSDRQSFINSLGNTYERVFSAVDSGDSGAKLSLYSRLNRQGLLAEIEKRQAQLASLPGPQQEIANDLRALTQKLASVSLSEKHRKSLIILKEKLETQLYRLLPKLKPRLVEVDQVAAVLPDDSVLIEFQRYQPFDGKKDLDQQWADTRYMALLLRPNGEIEHFDLGLAKSLERKIHVALRASEYGSLNAQELWLELGELLIKPLAQGTAGAKTWFISPDGEFNRIPFAALSAPSGDALLGEAVQLRLLTTGRELLDLAKRNDRVAQESLVVANPKFDYGRERLGSTRSLSSANSDSIQQRSGDLKSRYWQELLGTRKEGNAIAKLIDAKLLIEEQATALAVQQQVAPKVLHLASHAYYLADQKNANINEQRSEQSISDNRARKKHLQIENPLLRSGIVLAGANQPETNSKDDGYLTALEVAKLDWLGTEMVVISACESGKGDIEFGEGVYGLKRAIAVAGARSSLLSLWQVDDIGTAAFMQSFYQRLKAGVGRADALAATQKEFRQHAKVVWRNPYIWAAFQLSGDWKPVSW